MSLAVCVLAYSLVVLVLGPPLLTRVTRSGVAPKLGMAAWLAAMASVLGSWVAAIGLLGAELAGAWGHLERVLGGCVAGLAALARGGYGPAAQVGMGLAVALTAAGIVATAARLALALGRARAQTRRHADAAVLAARGTPRGPGGALLLDTDDRSVYCLPGRTRTIVITRGAIDVLDEPQLAAVLDHERAHLRGRHHQLLALTAALARILPRVRLFTQGATEIARLTELCADDAAARRHGRDTVVDALLALCAPTSPGADPYPAAALGAARSGVADRIDRLLSPPSPGRKRIAQVLTTTALLLGPMIIVALLLTQSPQCAAPML